MEWDATKATLIASTKCAKEGENIDVGSWEITTDGRDMTTVAGRRLTTTTDKKLFVSTDVVGSGYNTLTAGTKAATNTGAAPATLDGASFCGYGTKFVNGKCQADYDTTIKLCPAGGGSAGRGGEFECGTVGEASCKDAAPTTGTVQCGTGTGQHGDSACEHCDAHSAHDGRCNSVDCQWIEGKCKPAPSPTGGGAGTATGTCAVKAGGTNANCAAAASSIACTTASIANGVVGVANACVFTTAPKPLG